MTIKTVLDMKLTNIFVGVATGDSILPATTCQTLNGDFIWLTIRININVVTSMNSRSMLTNVNPNMVIMGMLHSVCWNNFDF